MTAIWIHVWSSIHFLILLLHLIILLILFSFTLLTALWIHVWSSVYFLILLLHMIILLFFFTLTIRHTSLYTFYIFYFKLFISNNPWFSLKLYSVISILQKDLHNSYPNLNSIFGYLLNHTHFFFHHYPSLSIYCTQEVWEKENMHKNSKIKKNEMFTKK